MRQTGFFVVDRVSTPHGCDLVCSHPKCRDHGIRFLYCKYCHAAVKPKPFRRHHVHGELAALSSSAAVVDGDVSAAAAAVNVC
jgi:hypothetical protein